MKKADFNAGLLTYLSDSPTPFHATANGCTLMEAAGFTRLNEADAWNLKPGGYYVTRNDSSLIAFIVGKKSPVETGIRMVGAHTDSPCLKVKPNPELRTRGYLNIGVEVYGGVLLNPWFDRDLSLAGRVTFETSKGALGSCLIDFKRTVGTIPSLAIHLDREANSERSVNPQTDIPPLVAQADDKVTLNDLLLREIKSQHKSVKAAHIHGYELCFYDTQRAAFSGLNNEFIASARLDNLLSCYTALASLPGADKNVTSLVVCNDHEEVGSTSAEGAQGTFLRDVLERLLPQGEDRIRTIAGSLLISTDNAHGVHPNFAAKHDPNHGPVLNKGPVIKINANQRYATNSETAAWFSSLAAASSVPVQTFVTRTDMACGSTIGPLTARELGVKTLDVGVPTFAMHSIRELAGSDDAHHLHQVLSAFFTHKGPFRI
ncbi:MAG: M18 family aminopeptidase [Pseudomonadales bacterium]|nr:M18 family aminopeptidase [Pseudomonadales bacterium]